MASRERRGAAPDPQRAAAARLHREPDVLEHGQQREDAGDLEGPPESRLRAPVHGLVCHVPAGELDPPRGRPHQPREQVEERRLAGPVRPDDPEELTGRHLEPDTGDDGCAADVEPEVSSPQDRGVRQRPTGTAWPPARCFRPRTSSPARRATCRSPDASAPGTWAAAWHGRTAGSAAPPSARRTASPRAR